MGGDGLYHGELLIHKELMLFCFMSALQYEMNEFKEHWNAKWIRQSAEAPAGRQNLLFSLPEIEGYTMQGTPVSNIDMRVIKDLLHIRHQPVSKDKDIREMLTLYCSVHRFAFPPRNAEGGIDLFVKLLDLMQADGLPV